MGLAIAPPAGCEIDFAEISGEAQCTAGHAGNKLETSGKQLKTG
jgi:hypothetical protein